MGSTGSTLDNGLLSEICAHAIEWRHALHQIPELLYDLPKTRTYVLARLAEFGCDNVHECVGRAGIVAVINGHQQKTAPTLAIRADMDALPIDEQSAVPYSSQHPGQMHACGHDGHTAILLATACYLTRHRDFPGQVVLIFQPAEEGGFGARDMLEANLIDAYGISEIYGLHNLPGLPTGCYSTRAGALLAASDRFEITIVGRGTHAATPHLGTDPIAAGAVLVNRINTIVSRQIDPLCHAVISLGKFHAGTTHNVIPDTARLAGTVRTLSNITQRKIRTALERMCDGIAQDIGVKIALDYHVGHPVTENHERSVDLLLSIAKIGEITIETAPIHMFSEDFSFMLQASPGAFVFIGNGDSAPLHHPEFDFDDRAIAAGAKIWLLLALLREG